MPICLAAGVTGGSQVRCPPSSPNLPNLPLRFLKQIHLSLVARYDPAAVLQDMDFDLVAGPGELSLQGRIEQMHPLVAGRDQRVGRVDCQGLDKG